MRKLATQLLGLTAFAAVLSSPALAAPMEIADLAKIRHAGNLAVSPDGETVAYTISVPRDVIAGDEDGRADSHLWVIRDGQEPIRFTSGQGSISAVQFAPDGREIYFRTRREEDDHTALYSIALTGGEAKKVFEFETSLGDYALSPDGGTLYFVARPEDDTEDFSNRGFKAWVYEEDQRFASIWSVSLGDEQAEAEKLFDGGHVSNFDLSADGETIVAAVAPSTLIDDFYMQRDLHVISVASGEETARFELPGKLGAFEISPDGRQVAFLAGSSINDTSEGVLMVGDIATGDYEQLTPQALQHIQDVDWLAEDEILATVHRGVESALVVYDTEGAEQDTLATSPDIVTRSAEVGSGQVYYIADSASHPREVFAAGRRSQARLSNHNAWLGDIDLAPQARFTWEARDGREIEGILITPNGSAPEGGWPLIMRVHGGPEAHDSDGWLTAYSSPGQFAAGDGYAVFYPNYRGSTGRGVAFSREHQNNYAEREFNDLVDGVNALAEAGIINRDRVGITGGSYGGYASMWGATALTEHFAAAVAFVGISNQISKIGTGDIPNEMYHVHSLKWPWDDNNEHWMELLERSPVFWAGQSTTPTLILHGEEDTRVNPSQSLEMYRSMKVRTDTPVRLVFYPGEGHGNRKAAARFDYAHRLMRWMDTYLGVDATRRDPMPAFKLDLEGLLGGDNQEDAE
ncbi:MAG: S9 family peptidase [Hyphomonadaceae bacterium]|nr:S9 family peptidase [Hyphomonadaceae bacterium]